jgi:hypothetical protein
MQAGEQACVYPRTHNLGISKGKPGEGAGHAHWPVVASTAHSFMSD